MHRFISASAFIVALLVACTPLRADDETYTIKFKQLGKGGTGSYEIREKGEFNERVSNAGGMTFINDSFKYDEKLVFWERVYARPAGELPTKALRGYGEARMIWDDDSLVLPVQGKRVTVIRDGDEYSYKIENGEDEDDRFKDLMAYEFEDDITMSEFLPTKPLKLKETFRFDAKHVARGLSKKINHLAVDANKAKGLGRLTEVYTKEGRQFGKLTSHVEIPLKALVSEGKKIPLRKDDKITIQVQFDLCIDGSAHQGTVKVVYHTATNFADDFDGEKVTVKLVYRADRAITIKEMTAKK